MSSQKEMQQTLRNLGIDIETFDWIDIGSCSTIDPELITSDKDIFFDGYEKSSTVAKVTDEICARCPVTRQCFDYGQENGLTGCWGGFYLIKGEVDASRNKHKDEVIVKRLTEKIFSNE
jgi:transcription factor WhiB